MDFRKNAGFIITNSMTVGESEIVLGVHEKHPNMFVTWECSDKNSYYQGHYFDNLLSAQKDFCKRDVEKAKFYEQQHTPKKHELER